MEILASSCLSPYLTVSCIDRKPKFILKLTLFQVRPRKSQLVKLAEAQTWNPTFCIRTNDSYRSRNCRNCDGDFSPGFLSSSICWLNKRFSSQSLFSKSYLNLLKSRKCTGGPQKVINCSEKIRRHVSVLFIQLVATVLLVTSVSIAVNNDPSWALSEENLLFLEAWRTIDRAYVDKTFNGQSWFRYRENALRNEPMNTRQETYMAIRKMLATLDDPFTRFLEPDKFKNLRAVWNSRVSYWCWAVNRLPCWI